MKLAVSFFSLSLCILLFVLFPQTTNAQSFLNFGGAEIRLSSVPTVPSPQEEVRWQIQSFVHDLKRSTISWRINGVEELRGIGETYFTNISPRAGAQQTLSVQITTPTGEQLSLNETIAPADVDLVYEADTYTPPLYAGRSLFTHQSSITIAAIPHFVQNGQRIPLENLIYTWEVNGTIDSVNSGVGRDSYTYRGRVISRSTNITVTVESVSGNLKAKKIIAVNPQDPEVRLYENNPLQGLMFEKALRGYFTLEREGLEISAVPYFFSTATRDSASLVYQWGENGKLINDKTLSSDLQVANPGLSRTGLSDITTRVTHVANILQSATIGFGLNVKGSNQINLDNENEVTVF